ncbi:hypothetical protein D9M68_986090 [compost metagenome]
MASKSDRPVVLHAFHAVARELIRGMLLRLIDAGAMGLHGRVGASLLANIGVSR